MRTPNAKILTVEPDLELVFTYEEWIRNKHAVLKQVESTASALGLSVPYPRYSWMTNTVRFPIANPDLQKDESVHDLLYF